MRLPDHVQAVVEAAVGAVQDCFPVGGGCIANASRVETAGGTYFLKWSTEDVALFEAEAAGLRALREAGSPLRIPEVVAQAHGVLVLEWLEPGQKTKRFWHALGEGLAELHRRAGSRYGFGEDNFIGRLPQPNAWADDWPTFFRDYRLQPQIALAKQQGYWQPAWNAFADDLLARLPELVPASPEASPLHGDLWSGNVYAVAPDEPALVDPAFYYGHREADLAMTSLFGGFDRAFYDAYNATWPLDPEYADRRDLYNLYHLLSHLNHFGNSYAASVGTVLRSYYEE